MVHLNSQGGTISHSLYVDAVDPNMNRIPLCRTGGEVHNEKKDYGRPAQPSKSGVLTPDSGVVPSSFT